MKLYALSAIVARARHRRPQGSSRLSIASCRPIDLGRGDQRTPEYARAQSQPEDADARGRRLRALGVERHPVLPRGQAAARAGSGHADLRARPTSCAGSPGRARIGMRSRAAWSRSRRPRRRCSASAPPDPAFIARGEQNFARFAAVLDDQLEGEGVAHRRAAHDRRFLHRRLRADRSRAWGCRSRASPKSAAGTKAWRRCPHGGMRSPPRTPPWPPGSRKGGVTRSRRALPLGG